MSARIQDLARFRMPPGFRGRSAATVQLWRLVQATLFACSPQILYGWRRWLLRRFGARVGAGALIRPSARVAFPWKVAIGARAWIGDRVDLYALGPIEIGADAVVSQDSYLCAGSHDPARVEFPILARPVRVGAEAWIAAGAFVAPGVTIGAGAVVGARAVVFADVPDGMVAHGHPARVVRARRPSDRGAGAAEDQRDPITPR